MPALTRTLPRFVLLYASMYAAFGVSSPFLPAFVNERGLPPGELGIVLAAGTAIRLVSAPLAGRIGDLLRNLRAVLVTFLVLAALATLGYFSATGLWSFLVVSVLHSFALAPTTVLADALALGRCDGAESGRRRGFEYAWVRGSGSAAFIAGTLVSGQWVGAHGLGAILGLQAGLLAACAVAALWVPELPRTPTSDAVRAPAGAVLLLLRMPRFRTLVLAAALILGSHAMHDSFAVIRWRAAGISPATTSMLWSESVAAEVLVFFVFGPRLIRRLTAPGAIALAAVAGILRWAVMAQTTHLVALALVQPLHGITFALLHLACMRVIASVAPAGLEGTAQAIYGALGIGTATALLTLIAGWLYSRAGAHGFWLMAALCALGLLAAIRLGVYEGASPR